MTQRLVLFDTDHIKHYVFATGRLTEIRGASALLEELNRYNTAQIIRDASPDADIVYHNGGSILTLVPTSDARPVITAVEALYRQKTLTATISGSDIPYDANGPFGDQVRQTSVRLRRVKDEKGVESHVTIVPWLHICDACGQHPASLAHGDQLICAACQIKRDRGTQQRSIFWKGEGRTDRLGFMDVAGQAGDRHWQDCQLPRDLDEIGAVSRLPGYVGFLYADANNMGRILRALQNRKDYEAFANNVDLLTRDVVHQALLSHAQPRPVEDRKVAPFEILLMGGDDLMLITAADLAVDVALDIVRSYEQRAPEETGHDLTLSLGFVLAHARFPVYAMYDLASNLLRSAKKVGGSALDFAVVTAAGSRDLDWLREEVLTEKSFRVRPSEGWRYGLTQRPYSLAHFERLCYHARQLRAFRFPQGQLQALYEGLFVSGIEASLRAITVMGRASDTHKTELQAFFEGFGSLPVVAPPWRKPKDGENRLSTALGDLVELYRFVTAPGKGEEDAGND